MEFEDLIHENITRDTAQKLIDSFCEEVPPEGAIDRILDIDIDTLTPKGGPDWVGIIPNEGGGFYLGMQRDELTAVIYPAAS